MKHLDLFSGIGGFALAASEVWGDDHEIVGFCDNDGFCQNVLRKNFPNVPIYGDIRELTANTLRERLEGVTAKNDGDKEPVGKRCVVGVGPEPSNRIDLLTGGFPCQPFSNAGKKRGDKDDRYLWPEMLRVIRETRPTWIIGENVAGIINMALDQVCADLEGEGYEVQPFVIPACAVDAPHRRDRVWIVARSNSERVDRTGRGGAGNVACAAGEVEGKRHQRERRRAAPHDGHSDASYTEGAERKGAGHPRSGRPRPANRNSFARDWREVAAATCHDRMDDGLPEELVDFSNPDGTPKKKVDPLRAFVLPDGFLISASRLRRESLKAYGNAIVPQVAVEIMRAIKASS